MKTWLIVCALTAVLWTVSPSDAQATGSSAPIIAFGAQREAIKSQPILHRQNRPLHFYGNTVRRRHAHGR
jgi:hypothetical protein